MPNSKNRNLGILVVVASVLLFTLYPSANSLMMYSSTITVTPEKMYGGVETVQVTGSIPNEMDRDQRGFFGGVFWNPTNAVFQITRIEFNASSATNQVFNGVEQGTGRSYPTSGWILDAGKKAAYLTPSIIVNPHTAQEFFVRIDGNHKAETFNVKIKVTANGTVYEKSYSTVQNSIDRPLSVLWLGNGTTPQYVVPVIKGQQTTFYISLQEDSNRVAISSNGKLTINLPPEFTGIQNVGSIGWGAPTIIGNKIEVNNTVAIRGSYITYAFRAVTPTSKGLYMINASFTGSPNENPVGNFCVRVTDDSRAILYCDEFVRVDHQWTAVGSSPYLSAIDYPSNYVHTAHRNDKEGNFGFQDSGVETVNNVTLDIYCWSARSGDSISVKISDGAQLIDLGLVQLPVSPAWVSLNVTAYLNTPQKVNAAQLWFQWAVADNAGHAYIDCARLRLNR